MNEATEPCLEARGLRKRYPNGVEAVRDLSLSVRRGEVLGLAESTGEAFYKAEEAAQSPLPLEGTALISVNANDKAEAVEVAKSLHEDGFRILATGSTYERITAAGVPAERINKLYEGRPNILDEITNGNIQLIVNSPAGKKETHHDDSYLRKGAIKYKVPYITTMAAAKAAAEGVARVKATGRGEVKSLQEWHALIREK